MGQMRLDKFLADAGIGTRSEVKNHIKKGLISVNSTIAKKPDIKVNPNEDTILYRDEIIRLEEFEYYLLNKPSGYVSATKDNTAPTVLSLIDSKRKDLFPVGRLDKDTEGLLLITNDSLLSHQLLSPKYHVDKTYYAIVEGEVTQTDIDDFANGVFIGDEDLSTALPATLSIVSDYNPEENLSYTEVVIHEGKFHQVKRMFQAVGKKVVYLKRTGFGKLTLPKDLALGEYQKIERVDLLDY